MEIASHPKTITIGSLSASGYWAKYLPAWMMGGTNESPRTEMTEGWASDTTKVGAQHQLGIFIRSHWEGWPAKELGNISDLCCSQPEWSERRRVTVTNSPKFDSFLPVTGSTRWWLQRRDHWLLFTASQVTKVAYYQHESTIGSEGVWFVVTRP